MTRWYISLVAWFEFAAETVHIYMPSLSILPEKQTERKSGESFYS